MSPKNLVCESTMSTRQLIKRILRPSPSLTVSHAKLTALLLAVGMSSLPLVVTAQTPCLSITANGGNGNGTADNTAAFNATVNQLSSSGGCIAFPAGKYRFNSSVSINYPAATYAVTITGDGADSTILYFPASNGVVVNSKNGQINQSIMVRDLTFTTGAAGGYAALTLNKPGNLVQFGQSEVINSVFRGDDGAALSDYWTTAIDVTGLSNINFDADVVFGSRSGNVGTGIVLTGTGSGQATFTGRFGRTAAGKSFGLALPACATAAFVEALSQTTTSSCTCPPPTQQPFGIVYNIAHSEFNSLAQGVVVGNLIQGVTVAQSTFSKGVTGILVQTGATGIAEVTAIGSTFSGSGSQVDLEAPVASVILNGNLINVSPNTAGVNFGVGGGEQNTLSNNIFVGSGSTPSGTGISVNFVEPPPGQTQSYIAFSSMAGNVFFNLATGVDLTTSIFSNVQANNYAFTTTLVNNPNTAGGNSVGVATP